MRDDITVGSNPAASSFCFMPGEGDPGPTELYTQRTRSLQGSSGLVQVQSPGTKGVLSNWSAQLTVTQPPSGHWGFESLHSHAS